MNLGCKALECKALKSLRVRIVTLNVRRNGNSERLRRLWELLESTMRCVADPPERYVQFAREWAIVRAKKSGLHFAALLVFVCRGIPQGATLVTLFILHHTSELHTRCSTYEE